MAETVGITIPKVKMCIQRIAGDPVDHLNSMVSHFSIGVIHATPEGMALKATKEATEFNEEPSLEEAADVLVCITGWAVLSGHHLSDIVDAAIAKMNVNIHERTWERQDDGTYQHVNVDKDQLALTSPGHRYGNGRR